MAKNSESTRVEQVTKMVTETLDLSSNSLLIYVSIVLMLLAGKDPDDGGYNLSTEQWGIVYDVLIHLNTTKSLKAAEKLSRDKNVF